MAQEAQIGAPEEPLLYPRQPVWKYLWKAIDIFFAQVNHILVFTNKHMPTVWPNSTKRHSSSGCCNLRTAHTPPPHIHSGRNPPPHTHTHHTPPQPHTHTEVCVYTEQRERERERERERARAKEKERTRYKSHTFNAAAEGGGGGGGLLISQSKLLPTCTTDC